jgi:putative membrane protein
MKQFTLIAAAAMLSACGSGDKEAPASDTSQSTEAANDMAVPAVAPAMPTDAAGYIAKAGAGDLWEIQSSQALLGKSTRDDVKAFARMMIDNHGKSTAKVKAAAAAASIKVPPPALDADQQQALDEIRNASATDVDAVYLRNQRTVHDSALALHRTYAASGDTDSLKKAAGEIVPVVEQHIAELEKLAAPMETSSAR